MKLFIMSLKNRKDLRDLLLIFKHNCIKRGISAEFYISEKETDEIINEMLTKKYVSWVGNSFRKNKDALVAEFGCFKTHIDLWKKCSQDTENYLIIEDSSKIDMSLFDKETFEQTEDIIFYNNDYYINENILCGFGLSAYKITPESSKKLLALCLPMAYPLDIMIRHLCNHKLINYKLGQQFVSRNNDVEHSTEKNQQNLNARQSFEYMYNRREELNLSFEFI